MLGWSAVGKRRKEGETVPYSSATLTRSTVPGAVRDEWIRHYVYLVLVFGGVYEGVRIASAPTLGFDATDWMSAAVYVALVALVLARARARLLAHSVLAAFAFGAIRALVQTSFSGTFALFECTVPILAAVFVGRRLPYVAIAGGVCAYSLFAFLRVRGDLLPAPNGRLVDPTLFFNWLRVTLLLAVVVAPSVWLVSRVTSALEASMKELADARALHDAQVKLRVEAESALKRAVERRDQSRQMEAAGLLIGGVVHDLRNSLAALQLWSGSLRTEATADAAVREAAERIETQCAETARVTKDLLGIARPSPYAAAKSPLWPQVAAAIGVLDRALPEDVHVVGRSEVEEDLWVAFEASALTSVILAVAASARLQVSSRFSIIVRAPLLDERAAMQGCAAVVEFVLDGSSSPPDGSALADEVLEHGGKLLVPGDGRREGSTRLLLPAVFESPATEQAHG